MIMSWRFLVQPGALACGVIVTVTAVAWRLSVLATARVPPDILGSMDLFSYFYPMLDLGFSEMRAGRLFLWNPYQLAGVPGLATLQSGFLYPPHLAYLFLPTHTAQGVMAFGHVVFSAVAMLVLARVLSMGWTVATGVALSYAFTAALPAIVWPPGLEAQSWLPLGIAAIHRVMSNGDRRWLPVVSASVAMPILAGGYQSSVYLLYTYAIYFTLIVARHVATKEGGVEFRIAAAYVAGFAIIGAAVAMPQLLPTFELARQGARSTVALAPEQVLPLGRPVQTFAELLSNAVLPSDHRSFFYLGAIALSLATVGALSGGLVVCLVTLLGAWGVLGVLAPTWFLNLQSALPAMAWFRLPWRAFVLAQFATVVLAGLGIERLTRRTSGAGRLVVPVVVAGCLTWCAYVRAPGWSSWIALAALAVVAGSAVVGRPHDRWMRAVRAAIVGLLVFDAVGYSSESRLLPYTHDGWRNLYRSATTMRELGAQAGTSRFLRLGTSLAIADSLKIPSLYRLYSPVDYEPLAMADHGEFFAYAANGTIGPSQSRWPFAGRPEMRLTPASNARRRRFLNLLSVRMFEMPTLGLLDPGLADFVRRLRPIKVDPNSGVDPNSVKLFEDAAALPRAYGVYRAECISDRPQQFARLAAEDFDPATSVVVDADCADLSLGGGMGPAPVSIAQYEPTNVRLKAQMAAPGLVVLTDSYYPGWQVLVNGKRSEVLRANAIVRAVPVPAGNVEIEFRYRPTSFYAGLGFAALGLIVAVLSLRTARSFTQGSSRSLRPSFRDGAR